MTTTIEIPAPVFEQAKNLAEAQGMSIEQLLTQALEEKLGNASGPGHGGEAAWTKGFGAFGKTAEMRAETDRIQKLIDGEFERVEPEDLE